MNYSQLQHKISNVLKVSLTKSIETLFSFTIVHPREVFKAAIRYSSASIICVHNQPGKYPTPCEPDIELTKRLILVGELIRIDVLDHVVIGGGFIL